MYWEERKYIKKGAVHFVVSPSPVVRLPSVSDWCLVHFPSFILASGWYRLLDLFKQWKLKFWYSCPLCVASLKLMGYSTVAPLCPSSLQICLSDAFVRMNVFGSDVFLESSCSILYVLRWCWDADFILEMQNDLFLCLGNIWSSDLSAGVGQFDIQTCHK